MMLEEQQQVAAEIAATQGAIDADALETKIEASEQIKEAKSEAKQEKKTPSKETPAAPVDRVVVLDSSALQQSVKETVEKTVKDSVRAALQESSAKQEETPKPEPKAEAKAEPKSPDPAPVVSTPVKESKAEEEHRLSTSAFRALKAKSEEKGRNKAMEDINKTVQEAGYSSLKEALADLRQIKQQSAVQTQAPQAAAPTQPAAPEAKNNSFAEAELRKAQKEQTRLAQALDAEKQRAQQAEKQFKASQKKIEAMQIDQDLRETAIKANVKDVDYAMTLLQRELASKSDDELRTFDESAYFAGLRGTHGHLFGERAEPATTSRVADPTHPNVTQTQKQTANQVGKGDGMKMPDQDYRTRIKELGLALPNL
jgi:hypothetical protein